MADLKIVNGLVIDGSGSPGFHATVLVKDEKVTLHRGEHWQARALQGVEGLLEHQGGLAGEATGPTRLALTFRFGNVSFSAVLENCQIHAGREVFTGRGDSSISYPAYP